MISWDVAERTIDATSQACRRSLQHTLENPDATLSPNCMAEVGKVLERQYRRGDARSRGGNGGAEDDATKNAPTLHKSQGSDADKRRADSRTAAIVFCFVSCVMVVFAGIALYIAEIRRANGRQSTRSDKRLHKRKNDRMRDRGKRRR